jgi:NADH:ubiquinone oxidoreductase subunit 6 (subunit J)
MSPSPIRESATRNARGSNDRNVAALALRGTALLAAAAMLVLRHPMRVALALVVTMLALAGVYALLGVHVIAVFQVLIYVGAVMVFMVYVIMLLDVRDRSYSGKFSRLLVPAFVGSLLLLAVLAHALWQDLPAPSTAVRRDGVRSPAVLDCLPERILAALRTGLRAAGRRRRRRRWPSSKWDGATMDKTQMLVALSASLFRAGACWASSSGATCW